MELKKFGEWTVVDKSCKQTDDGRLMWNCICSCGNERIVKGVDLIKGKSKSCGCLRFKKVTDGRHKHGMTGTPEYMAWNNMIKNHTGDINPEWKLFSLFFEDMGKRPSKSHRLYRLHQDKPFSKSNCMWIKRGELKIINMIEKETFI